MILCQAWQKILFLPLLAVHVLGGSFWRACDDGSDRSTNGRLSLGDKLESKIVGGEPAIQGQFPYQVSLRRAGWSASHFCGGAILDKKHVLTAAHCVMELTPTDLDIIAGDILRDRSSCTSVRRSVSDIFIHDNYSIPVSFANDIAVLRITKEFPTDSSTIQKIRIPNTTIAHTHTECQVSGWGTVAYGNPQMPNRLRYANITVQAEATCAQIYSGGFTPGMICANGYGRDSCQGDSGGPMQCDSMLVGIVSWGYQCGVPKYPGVYTAVAYYEEWVRYQLVRPSGSHRVTGLQPFIAVLVTLFLMMLQLSFR